MQWQLQSVEALQAWRGFEFLMRAATKLGNEEFYLLLIPIFYLGISPRAGLRLGLLVLLGDALNNLIKLACGLPRPYWIDPKVLPLDTEASFGFPSSHAQNATSVWLFLANLGSRRWLWPAAIILILLISLSRVYLGVHFPTDVIGGWIIGGAFLFLFLKFEPKALAKFENAAFPMQLFVATALALGILLLGALVLELTQNIVSHPPEYASFVLDARSLESLVSRSGAIWGLLVGYAMALRGARFEPHSAFGKRIIAVVFGVAGVLLLWRGLAAIFPREPEMVGFFFRFLRYALMTWWVVFLAPFLLLRFRLAAPQRSRDELINNL